MDMFESTEIDELVEELTEYSRKYYSGEDTISDPEYDALEAKLRALDPTNDYFNKVGADIVSSTFNKVPHAIKMLSLDKAYSEKDVVKWANGTGYPNALGIAMPKMDGFALSLIYERQDGDTFSLVRAATRGKGDSGEDVTENAKQIKDIPVAIIGPNLTVDNFEVRGEAYMQLQTFIDLGLEKQGYENCRNIAPGSVRQKDPRVTASRKLNFFAYNMLGLGIGKMTERLDKAKTLGFKAVPFLSIPLFSDSIASTLHTFEKSRKEFGYEIDGVVFGLDDIDKIEALGNTSHHPRGFIAWKFPSEETETTLTAINLQVSRTGMINPVGIYDSIKIEGGNLTNATLHNYSEIERLEPG